MTPPPGLLRRLSALFYDTLLLAATLFVGTAVLLAIRGGQPLAPRDPVYSIYLLSLSFVFFGWSWTHGGQTLGMRTWHIRLESDGGGPLSWGRAAVRFLAALVSLGLFGLGFWCAIWDREKRCWHDRVAHTRLTWDATSTERSS